jgi:hypothetical protein
MTSMDVLDRRDIYGSLETAAMGRAPAAARYSFAGQEAVSMILYRIHPVEGSDA